MIRKIAKTGIVVLVLLATIGSVLATIDVTSISKYDYKGQQLTRDHLITGDKVVFEVVTDRLYSGMYVKILPADAGGAGCVMLDSTHYRCTHTIINSPPGVHEFYIYAKDYETCEPYQTGLLMAATLNPIRYPYVIARMQYSRGLVTAVSPTELTFYGKGVVGRNYQLVYNTETTSKVKPSYITCLGPTFKSEPTIMDDYIKPANGWMLTDPIVVDWQSWLTDGKREAIWVVTAGDVDCEAHKFVAWHPAQYLFAATAI